MQRLTQAIGISLVVFAGVLAAVIATRIDAATVSLIAGVVVGLSIGMPAAAAIAIAAFRTREQAERPRRDAYWERAPGAREALPWAAGAPAASPQRMAEAPVWFNRRRVFHVVGEDGDVSPAD